MDVMMLLGLNEALGQLSMACSVCQYSRVLRTALEFEVEGQRRRGKLKRAWRKQDG